MPELDWKLIGGGDICKRYIEINNPVQLFFPEKMFVALIIMIICTLGTIKFGITHIIIIMIICTQGTIKFGITHIL